MKFEMKRLFALILLAAGFASSAHASYVPVTWNDSADLGNGVYIGSGRSYTYTHDLNDNGFRPSLDWIEQFDLSINLEDDSTKDGFELALVNVPGILDAGSTNDFNFNFSASIDEFGGSILGLLQLNIFGTLTVTISSLWGDFNLISSELTAQGVSHTSTNVPEPGALGLLGVGLLGMAISMRRRKPASR